MKNRGRGSVGRAFTRMKRYYNDKEFRLKKLELRRKYCQNPEYKIKEYERSRKRARILSEFANKKCKKCGKLLDYRAKSGFCRRHNKGRGKKK